MRTGLLTTGALFLAVTVPSAAAQPGAEPSEAPAPPPPPAEPAFRLSGGVSAGLGAIDADCEACPAAISAGFGGQVGARLGGSLFLGLGFAVATGSSGTTTGLFGQSRDEVLFALAGVARLFATSRLWWGGGVGFTNYRPPDRDSESGALLLGNAGYEFVHFHVSGLDIALELQLRGTAARAGDHTVATGALLFGGMVSQGAADAAP
jgi:hypothetical protein